MSKKNNINSYIAHIVTDEKFIDMAIREFELQKIIKNRYIIIAKNKFNLSHIKSKFIEFHTLKSTVNILNSSACKGVIFHSLSQPSLLRYIPQEKKVIWIGWGYDYYDRLLKTAFPDGLLLENTRNLLEKYEHSQPLRRLINKLKYNIKNKLSGELNQKILLNRIDAFSPVLDEEYIIACKENSWFKPQYIQWNYGTAEDDFSLNSSDIKLGENLLIGNSATFENNHLEIFQYINNNFDWRNSKIIVPLSYGNSWYRDEIIKHGQEIFKENFTPLTKFFSNEEYIKILQSCGHVFMNHIRQQAVGNICIMLLKGARIYMNPNSILYAWLKKNGVKITPIALNFKEKNATKSNLKNLSDAEKDINIGIINEIWGRSNQNKKTENLIKLIVDNNPVKF